MSKSNAETINQAKELVDHCYNLAKRKASFGKLDWTDHLEEGHFYSQAKINASLRDLDPVHELIDLIENANKELIGLPKDAKSQYSAEITKIETKIEDTKKYLTQTCLEAIDQNIKELNGIISRNKTGADKMNAQGTLNRMYSAKQYIDRLGEKYKKIAGYGTIDTKLEIARNKFEQAYGSKKGV